ncbi:DUF789 domain-containing protein [Cephalotus follicularis]|uniref:DUF789 domain-containing protein n=1 Tax=Cephalotus follicularis TaxID=3775 RepID=A0A1Q3B345_CEPFO|nr:DUF789 domain-containing protein [Cephalotus follicularis]
MRACSPWDMKVLSSRDSINSNLESFLQCVTPSIPTKLIPSLQKCVGSSNGFWQAPGKDMMEGFYLKDLWKGYSEWSVYGAAVPLLLDNGETVIQYYCPSLSAIQIYTRRPVVSFSESSRRAKFESDSWSDDSESDRVSKSLSSNSSRTSDAASDDSIANQIGLVQTSERFGHLYCQYNETTCPYDRVPLTQKIDELAKEFPGVLKLHSAELSPYSWMAVAWYPVYQIPAVKNVKELSACFLTYHSLSSCFQGPRETIQEEDEEQKCTGDDVREDINGGKGGKEDGRGVTSLNPFAFSTYKILGTLWKNPETSDEERITSQQSAAWSWLNQLKFRHHDFDFFMYRS